MNKAKTTMMFGSFVLVFVAAIAGGSIVRGESSPWVWKELTNRHVAPSFADQLGVVVWYSAFYSIGFFVPYWSTTFVLFVGRQRASGLKPVPPMPINHRWGRFFISLSALVLFLLLLDSIVAFVRALPTEKWNGWLMTIGLALAGFFAYQAYISFTRTEDRQSTQVP